jgi:hypothetical protein
MVSVAIKSARRALVFLVALCAFGTRIAAAQTGLVVIGGGATEHDRTVVGTAIEKAVRGAGWLLPTKPVVKKEADGLLNCDNAEAPWTCVPATVTGKGIKEVLVVSVEATQAANGASLIVITGRLIATEPPSFAFLQKFCEHCADDRLGDAGGELAGRLIQELAARAGRTVVHFKSDPAIAEIILDGKKLGVTEATYDTTPGKHTAMLQKPGFVAEFREFTVEEGKTAEVSVTLKSSDVGPIKQPDPQGTPKSSRSLLAPGITIGAGGVLAIFGGALLYRGQQDSDKYEYTRANAIGLTTGLIGLGAIGAGLYLVWRGDQSSAPTASIGSDRVLVQWAGRF